MWGGGVNASNERLVLTCFPLADVALSLCPALRALCTRLSSNLSASRLTILSTLIGDRSEKFAGVEDFLLAAEGGPGLGMLTLDLAAMASLNTSHCSSRSVLSVPNHVIVMTMSHDLSTHQIVVLLV